MPDISHTEKYIDKYGEKFAKEFEVLLLELDLSEKISKKIIGSFKKNKKTKYLLQCQYGKPYNDNSIFEDVECLFLNEKSAEKILSCDISNMKYIRFKNL